MKCLIKIQFTWEFFFFCSNLQYDEEYLQTIHGVETWKLGNTRKFTNQEKVRKIHKSEKKKTDNSKYIYIYI